VLRTEELTIEVAGRVVVDEAWFSVYAGDKVGLVGRNGAGKTSLLCTIVGDRRPTIGHAQVMGALGYLPQDQRADRARAKDVAMTTCFPLGDSTSGVSGSRHSAATGRRPH
jgi:ATPase subunit of ABC transporter with duplicated ATPase domains